MRVVQVLPEHAVPPVVPGECPVPVPGAGQMLVRVHAAGVIVSELAWWPTRHAKDGSVRVRAVPAHEFSGVVHATGADADSNFPPGTEVFGMNDWFEEGAAAEFCLAVPGSVARNPQSLSHAEAATLPISALTAWQGLFRHGHLRAGDRVLVHGGAGAVGAFAVQMARAAGATVTTTCSAASSELCRSLGANKTIDYQTHRFEEAAGPMDVVFDTVGGETRHRSWALLGAAGRMVTVAADAESSSDPRVKPASFIVEPDGDRLAELAQQVESGTLRTFVKAVLPMADAATAYTAERSWPGTYGKLVLDCSS